MGTLYYCDYNDAIRTGTKFLLLKAFEVDSTRVIVLAPSGKIFFSRIRYFSDFPSGTRND